MEIDLEMLDIWRTSARERKEMSWSQKVMYLTLVKMIFRVYQ